MYLDIQIYYNLYNRKKKYNDIINRYFTSDFEIEEFISDYSLLYKSLEKMKDKDRNLLLMKYEQGLSLSEIAIILNRPVGSLKTELYRARNRLKKIYVESEEL